MLKQRVNADNDYDFEVNLVGRRFAPALFSCNSLFIKVLWLIIQKITRCVQRLKRLHPLKVVYFKTFVSF